MLPIRKFSGQIEVTETLDLPNVSPGGTKLTRLCVVIYKPEIHEDGLRDFKCPDFISGITINFHNKLKTSILELNDFREGFNNKLNLDMFGASNFQKNWVSIHIEPTNDIDCSFLVDTSKESFSRVSQDRGILLYFKVLRYDPKTNNIVTSQAKSLSLGGDKYRLTNNIPGPNISEFTVALDFGNHSSVAAIKVGSDNFKTISMSSIVSINPKLPMDQFPTANDSDGSSPHKYLCAGKYDEIEHHYSRESIQFLTGNDLEKGIRPRSAESTSGSHRFPKRSLTHPDSQVDLDGNIFSIPKESFDKIFVKENNNTQDYLVPKRLPAELFLTDFFERIAAFDDFPTQQSERVGTPKRIVFTYPTTYMRGAIYSFYKSILRASLRRMNVTPKNDKKYGEFSANLSNDEIFCKDFEKIKNQLNNPYNSRNNNELPKVFSFEGMIDEASASAYYYIRKYLVSRDNFGVDGFRLTHPEGCRIIVIDCGAGTTDAVAFDLIPEKSMDRWVLKVKLAQRTGDTVFCGDFVTKQIARLIKAKLYYFSMGLQKKENSNKLIDSHNQAEPFSAKILNVKEFINRVYSNSIQDLNSKYPELNTDGPPGGEGEKYLKELIKESELIKIKLTGINRNIPVKLNGSFFSKLYELLGGDRSLSFGDGYKDTSIYVEEINELISDQLDELISTVNNAMVLTRKQNDEKNDNKIIFKVLLTGKGGLYPLVLQRFREKLSVVSPESQVSSLFGESDKANDTDKIAELKNCVSIGACWWCDDQNTVSPEIIFEKTLADVLPFDLVIEIDNIEKVIFPEGTKYKEMEDPSDEEFPLSKLRTKNSNGTVIKCITLMQKFPGNSKAKVLSVYNFNVTPKESENFKIRWDEKKMDFVVDIINGKSGEQSQKDIEYCKSPLWSEPIR